MTPRRPLPTAEEGTASGYVRLSKEAGDTNMSKAGMVEDVKALAAREGLRLVGEVHVDDGITGSLRNRPEFLAWLNDAIEGRAGTLIAHHVDRMTREGVNVAARILDTIEGKDPETGKHIRGPVDLLDTKGLDSRTGDAAFRMRFVIQAEVAREERERMRQRARDMHRRAKAAGRWPGGTPPFGFEVVDNPKGAGKVLAVNAAEAAFLRECSKRILAGTNLSAVVRYANGKDGLAPRRAEAWSRITMRQCLTGQVASGSILTPDESAALRQTLKQIPDARKGRRQGARLLSGLVRCVTCDGLMTVSKRTRDGYVTYRCMGGAEGRCSRPTLISALPLEAYVTSEFLRRHGDAPYMVRRATVAGAAAVEAAQDEVTDALEDLRVEATPEAFARLQKAQAALAAAELVPKHTVVEVVPTGQTFAEVWEDGGVADRRELLAVSLGADILIRPGKRGPRGLDPERVLLLSQPPFSGAAVEEFVPGEVVS